MSTAQLVIVCLTVLALASLAVFVLTREAKGQAVPDVPTPAEGATIVVHLDGRVLQGTLEHAGGGVLVLAGGASVVSDGKFTPLGGRQYISRDRISQIQEM